MEYQLLIQGFLIGVTIAAPVGPIGILCIRRTLTEGRLAGFISGLGAASADALYGAVAAFGLTIVSVFLINQSIWLRLAGGMFLVYLGIRTALRVPKADWEVNTNSSSDRSLLNNYLSTFILTLTNPMTIISFAAIFAGFGLGRNTPNSPEPIRLVFGVFIGSLAWWLALSVITGIFRSKINHKTMLWINRIAGIIIFGFGLLALLSLIFRT